AAANMMLAILGGRPVLESRVPMLIGGGIDELVAKVLDQSGVKTEPELQSTAAALFRNLYGQRLFQRSQVYPNVLMTLHTLRGDGRTLYCVTNKERKFALPLLEFAGLSGFFSAVFCADTIEDRKPSPNMLRAACTHACVEAEKMLCVGDSRADIVAAQAAGCRVVAVDYGYHHNVPLDELRPDAIVSDMRQLLELSVHSKSDGAVLRAIA
ncbi:HAD-IA family hydrolase, partial [Steroidobacter sp.]|uniref:HAD-IA family hydrolase n=1 Tax=Steroidobacter sp. TaxID=1978227 RepID=UPI0025CFDABE